MAALAPAQVDYFYRHLPDVAMRHAYPLASFEAAVRNMMGGKPDLSDPDAKPMDPDRLYSASELLPWFARPTWLDEAAGGIPPAAAQDVMANLQHLPGWCLQLVDVRGVKAVAA